AICVLPEQLTKCAGQPDGIACDFSIGQGTCHGHVCLAVHCGDGVRTAPEDCDGADLGDQTCASRGFYEEGTGLRCGADCKLDTSGCIGFCQDGVKNGQEACDGADLGGQSCLDFGYYAADGLACTAICTLDRSACSGGFCGDGIINGNEICDGAPPD